MLSVDSSPSESAGSATRALHTGVEVAIRPSSELLEISQVASDTVCCVIDWLESSYLD
jgi:hypothetical protein